MLDRHLLTREGLRFGAFEPSWASVLVWTSGVVVLAILGGLLGVLLYLL